MYSLANGSVNEVLNLGTGEAGRHRGELLGANGLVSLNFVEVDLEDVFSAFHVGKRHMDFLVETTRAHGCGIEGLLVVGRTDDKNIILGLKAIHLGKDLVDGSAAGRMFHA